MESDSAPATEAAEAEIVELPCIASKLATRPRTIAPEQWRRYRTHVAEIFAAFGMELDTAGTRETPERFLSALFDATAGYDGDAKLLTTFPSEARAATSSRSQIIEGPISFHCLCEHHALPFYGAAYIAYIADGEIIGISKLTRLVRLFARRFTVQERLGEQIADTLTALVAPHGVAVHLEAEHLCTHMRGVTEPSRTVTTFWRGNFDEDADLRHEFLREVHTQRGALRG